MECFGVFFPNDFCQMHLASICQKIYMALVAFFVVQLFHNSTLAPASKMSNDGLNNSQLGSFQDGSAGFFRPETSCNPSAFVRLMQSSCWRHQDFITGWSGLTLPAQPVQNAGRRGEEKKSKQQTPLSGWMLADGFQIKAADSSACRPSASKNVLIFTRSWVSD